MVQRREGSLYPWTMLYKRDVGLITQFDIPVWMRDYAYLCKQAGDPNECTDRDSESLLAKLLEIGSKCFGDPEREEWFVSQFMNNHHVLLGYVEPNFEIDYRQLITGIVYRLGWIS